MNMKKLLALGTIGLLFTSAISVANETYETIEDNLRKVNNGAFADAPIEVLGEVGEPGFEDFYYVELGGQQIIVSSSGKYAMVGDLINLDTRTNLTEEFSRRGLARIAKAELAKFSDDEFVIFKPKGISKGEAYVLTDPTCFYCRKLHGDIDSLLKAGITVKYVPYPRSPLEDGQEPYELLKQVMCASDPVDAMDKIKRQTDSGMFVQASYKQECIDKIAKGKALGIKLDISGTPFLYLSTGRIVGGYLPPDQLINFFGS